jgi:PmbA protein
MEQLLEMAMRVSDSAEVYTIDTSGDRISFEDSRLKDIKSGIQSGVSLRVLKNGFYGFAYTKTLSNREKLIQNALDSLKGKVDGDFAFPLTKDIHDLNTFDPAAEKLSNSQIVDECSRVCDFFSRRIEGQINVSAHRSLGRLRLLNSSGTNLSFNSSSYGFHTGLLYPYSAAALHRTFISKSFQIFPEEYLQFLANTFNQSAQEVTPGRKITKVIFLPETLYVLMWRLQSATSGQSIYQNISPLAQKKDEKIFSENISVYNDPLHDELPGARAFDDEGTTCRFFPIIEKGVLKNFYYDLYFAHKLHAVPTGHGFKGSISAKPAPSLSNLTVIPGDTSFADMVQSVDSGIIVAGALGGHSGNIPYGDFSIGISPAIYIEKGEIIGNVKDVMIAGNIYDTLQHVLAIENTLHPSPGGNFPAILLDNMNVTLKK